MSLFFFLTDRRRRDEKKKTFCLFGINYVVETVFVLFCFVAVRAYLLISPDDPGSPMCS